MAVSREGDIWARILENKTIPQDNRDNRKIEINTLTQSLFRIIEDYERIAGSLDSQLNNACDQRNATKAARMDHQQHQQWSQEIKNLTAVKRQLGVHLADGQKFLSALQVKHGFVTAEVNTLPATIATSNNETSNDRIIQTDNSITRFNIINTDTTTVDTTTTDTTTTDTTPTTTTTTTTPTTPTTLSSSPVLRVPEDCPTIHEALNAAQTNRTIQTISLQEGTYTVSKDNDDETTYLNIDIPITITGRNESNNNVILLFGLSILENITEGRINVQHVTIRHLKGTGIVSESFFTLKNVIVEQCGGSGVCAYGKYGIGICTNVKIRHCAKSGAGAYENGSITLIGSKTSIHNNCTTGNMDDHGLTVYDSSSSTIQLVHPLTKEMVSINNGTTGYGNNWGAADGGDIYQIHTIGGEEDVDDVDDEAHHETEGTDPDATETTAPALLEETTTTDPPCTILVPEECQTMQEAVLKAQNDSCITTISVGQGSYIVDKDEFDQNVLHINFPIHIVGREDLSKNQVLFLFGIAMDGNIHQGNVHVQNLTIRNAERSGVLGRGAFTLEEVVVEQCGGHGVVASGTLDVGVCTNVEIVDCGKSGVFVASGGSVTFIGAKTSVRGNCTKNELNEYGLHVNVYSSSSKIQLVHPLTKETVATNNGGGGNWNAVDVESQQIKTITDLVHRAQMDYCMQNGE